MVGQYHERGDGGGEGLVAGHGGLERRLAAAVEVGEDGAKERNFRCTRDTN